MHTASHKTIPEKKQLIILNMPITAQVGDPKTNTLYEFHSSQGVATINNSAAVQQNQTSSFKYKANALTNYAQ
jgi:hypothetical protein